MNDAIKLPQLNKEMMSMAREMERAGLIEELIGDAMDDVMGGDELESEADEEVRENKQRKDARANHFYLGQRGKTKGN